MNSTLFCGEVGPAGGGALQRGITGYAEHIPCPDGISIFRLQKIVCLEEVI
ncbi:MAG: hypothetical protein ACFB0G_07890 [Leptolyngbyaceae cyanobacterium]